MKRFLLLVVFLILDSVPCKNFLGKDFQIGNNLNKEYLKYSKINGNELKKYIVNKEVYIIDTRDMTISVTGYIPNSIILPITMYSWISSVVPGGSNIVIITDEENYQNAIDSLIALNTYHLLGYVIYNEIINSSSFSIQEVEYDPNTKESISQIVENNDNIIDIREVSEFKETGVIKEAILIPLTTFQKDFKKIPSEGNVFIFCKSGMRAVVGMTFAKRAGYKNRMVIMKGGMNKAIEEGYPLVPYSE